jgi:hypothetical protein
MHIKRSATGAKPRLGDEPITVTPVSPDPCTWRKGKEIGGAIMHLEEERETMRTGLSKNKCIQQAIKPG